MPRQEFGPITAFAQVSHFYSGTTCINPFETRFVWSFQEFVQNYPEIREQLTDTDLRKIYVGLGIIDAATATPYLDQHVDAFPELLEGQHAFTVFHRPTPQDEFKLQYANAAYLNAIGNDFGTVLWITESRLMEQLYTPDVIEEFSSEWTIWYSGRFIRMNKIVGSGGINPAYIWYRQRFANWDWSELEVRVGMDGTELSEANQIAFSSIHRIAQVLSSAVERENTSTLLSASSVLARVRTDSQDLLIQSKALDGTLRWYETMLSIAENLFKDGPFPITVSNTENRVQLVSPSYASYVWYTVTDILGERFMNRLYRWVEWTVVDQAFKHYDKTGTYPDRISFFATRWNAWSMLAKNLNLGKLPREIEIIPKPKKLPDGHGTVRMNSVKPAPDLSALLK